MPLTAPAAAGKSSLAKAVAKKLSILHVDTGAIYRTIGYAAFARGLNAKDESQIAPLLKTIHIDMAFDEAGRQKMLLDGKDVSREIRLPEISMYASNVSALPCVRAYLLEMQRDIARKRSVIMDGRDIGTVVLPGRGSEDLPDGFRRGESAPPLSGAFRARHARAL